MARWVELFWTGCFVLSVLVQYNDPDPGRWVLMYGAAALICGWPGLPRRAEPFSGKVVIGLQGGELVPVIDHGIDFGIVRAVQVPLKL